MVQWAMAPAGAAGAGVTGAAAAAAGGSAAAMGGAAQLAPGAGNDAAGGTAGATAAAAAVTEVIDLTGDADMAEGGGAGRGRGRRASGCSIDLLPSDSDVEVERVLPATGGLGPKPVANSRQAAQLSVHAPHCKSGDEDAAELAAAPTLVPAVSVAAAVPAPAPAAALGPERAFAAAGAAPGNIAAAANPEAEAGGRAGVEAEAQAAAGNAAPGNTTAVVRLAPAAAATAEIPVAAPRAATLFEGIETWRGVTGMAGRCCAEASLEIYRAVKRARIQEAEVRAAWWQVQEREAVKGGSRVQETVVSPEMPRVQVVGEDFEGGPRLLRLPGSLNSVLRGAGEGGGGGGREGEAGAAGTARGPGTGSASGVRGSGEHAEADCNTSNSPGKSSNTSSGNNSGAAVSGVAAPACAGAPAFPGFSVSIGVRGSKARVQPAKIGDQPFMAGPSRSRTNSTGDGDATRPTTGAGPQPTTNGAARRGTSPAARPATSASPQPTTSGAARPATSAPLARPTTSAPLARPTTNGVAVALGTALLQRPASSHRFLSPPPRPAQGPGTTRPSPLPPTQVRPRYSAASKNSTRFFQA